MDGTRPHLRTVRHGLSPSGLHHRIAAVVNKIALECGVNSTLGGDRTRCRTDASGQGVFSDVFLADLYPDQRGTGDGEEDTDRLVERKQHIAREKKRMMSAIQAARIAYQARMIRATTAQGGRQPGRFGARGPTGPRKCRLVFF